MVFIYLNYLMIFSLQKGRSPLHAAVEKDWTDIVNMLITHGANVDIRDKVNVLINYIPSSL